MVCRRLAAAFLIVLSAGVAWAQCPNISNDTVREEGEISESQRRQINGYVDCWLKALGSGDAAQISASRNELIKPLYRGGSAFFNAAYSSALSARLAPLLTAEDDFVRINAMIVTARLRDTGMIGLIEAGLEDQNPAIRYWAAKASLGGEDAPTLAVKLFPQDTPAAADSRAEVEARLLEAFSKAAKTEREPWVLRQMLQALVNLQTPAAAPVVLSLLERRLEGRDLSDDDHSGVTAEVDGLKRLAQKIVFLRARKAAVATDDFLRRAAGLYYRYGKLGATRIAAVALGEKLTPEQSRAYQDMRLEADNMLRFILSQLDKDGKYELPPAQPGRRDADILGDFVSRWPAVLKKAGMTEAQLTGEATE